MMKDFVILSIFICFCRATVLPFQNRIVNGTDVKEKEFPYVVSLRYYNRHGCGAAIISESWLLTAAHCIVLNKIENATVLFGTIDLHDGEIAENCTVKVERVIVHPKYTPGFGYENDVALIQITPMFQYNDYVQAVKLTPSFEEIPVGANATVIGWGSNVTSGVSMDVLQKANLIIFPDLYCYVCYGWVFNSNVHLCAGVPEGGKGQCSGDSGGPLVVDGVLVGTVSWSYKPCTSPDYPGVYARITNYVNWITNETNVAL